MILMEEILDIQDVMSLSTMKQRLEYMSEYMNKKKKRMRKSGWKTLNLYDLSHGIYGI